MRECSSSQAATLLPREPALDDGRLEERIGLGRHDHGNMGVVLGRCSHHGRASDVNLLNALVHSSTTGDGVAEGIEVDHEQIESRDAQLFGCCAMLGIVVVSQQSAVDMGVQGLHATVEALRKPGHLRNLSDGDASSTNRRGGRSRGHDGNSVFMESTCQRDQTRLVGY